MSFIKEFQHLQISLKDLKSATNNFNDTNHIGSGGFGKVYKGEIILSGVLTMVAIKRLDKSLGQGITEFWKEIMMLSQYKHENLVSLLGFCDEDGENLLVYEYLSNRSLDLYLKSVDLSWYQRLSISLGAAMGLQYLHEPIEGSLQRVLHRDIKSANILLDHNWRPKIADFGLSKLGPANQQFTFVFSNAVGTMGYCDPLYAHTGFLTKESDVYSFGVVLFEVLCGRPCLQDYNDIRRYLTALSRKCYEEMKMDTIIHIGLKDNISLKCLERYSGVAYQCLHLDRAQRPTMGKVVQELRFALYYQSIHQSRIQEVSLKEIQVATNNFKMSIGKNRYGDEVYEGELSISARPTRVFIQRFPEHSGRTLSDYLKLVDKFSQLHHPNYISTLGYCNEEKEMIVVYEYPERGSLDQFIRRINDTTSLTWLQRLEICVGAGHGLSYLHSKNMYQDNFKSALIVLDDKWVAKIAALGISTQYSTGLDAYNSPEYIIDGIGKAQNNVFSFGMVLFEVLCGRLCTEEVDDNILSAKLIKDLYEKNKLDEIVDPALLRKEKISSSSVNRYSAIAYQCLLDDPQERSSMDHAVKELEELFRIEKRRHVSISQTKLKKEHSNANRTAVTIPDLKQISEPGSANASSIEKIVQCFQELFGQKKYIEAAELAAESPQGILRTPDTLAKFKSVPVQSGLTPPLLQYFGTLLTKGKLNAFESLELSRLAVNQNKKNLLKKWLAEDKLECNEELGDLVKTVDNDLALKIYIKARVNPKVVAAFAEQREFDQILIYSEQVGYVPDYLFLLQTILRSDPQGAVNFALMMSHMEGGCPVDFNDITDLFLQRNLIREATAFLLDVLKPDLPKHAHLQTKVLEFNLVVFPNVADDILAYGMFSHYDRARIAQLCEKAGLYVRALQNYTELPDIKRVIVNTHAIEPQSLVEFFGTLSQEWALECMKDLLLINMKGNLQIIVQVAKEYYEQLGVEACIKLFEQFKSYEGLYLFLGSYLSSSEDPEIHFKYIEAAVKTGHIEEVERVTRESNFYDAEKTKNFLIEAKLPDAKPLINVCDRFGFIPELIHYLYTNNMLRYIEGYVKQAGNAPLVVKQLRDDECPEDFIRGLIH